LKFSDAEAFADHPMHQRYITKKIVDRNTLIQFFAIVQDKYKPVSHEHQGIQEQVQKDRPEIGDRKHSESEKRTDSGSAGDTNVERPNKKRRGVS